MWIHLNSRKAQCNSAHNCTGLDSLSTWSASLFNPFMLCGDVVLHPLHTVASMYTWLLVCLCAFSIYSVHSVMSFQSFLFFWQCLLCFIKSLNVMYMWMFSARNSVGRKEPRCCAWVDVRQIRLWWGDQQGVPLTHVCYIRWVLVDPLWYLHKKQIKNRDCITCW